MRSTSAELVYNVVHGVTENTQVSQHPSGSTKTLDEPNIGQVDIKEFEGLPAHAPPRFWHVEKARRDLQEKSNIERRWQPRDSLKRTIILRSSTVRPFIVKALVAASTLSNRTVA